jgi:hypothetical protein
MLDNLRLKIRHACMEDDAIALKFHLERCVIGVEELMFEFEMLNNLKLKIIWGDQIAREIYEQQLHKADSVHSS